MASKLKKLGVDFHLDDDLSREGAESEFSLADDTDEFADSFSGKLAFTEENANLYLQDSVVDGRRDSGLKDAPLPRATEASPVARHYPIVPRVTFELVDANIIEGRSKYVLYTILIRPAGLDTVQALIERRYSDFCKLNSSLRRKYSHLMQDIAFPKKMVTGNFKPETIAQRSRAFEQFLSHIYTIDVLRLSNEFAEFFYRDDLSMAYDLLKKGQYVEALPQLKSAMHIQQRLLGETHEEVVKTVVAIAATCYATGQLTLAQTFADAALACIGTDDHNSLLPSLLAMSIRLCWKLGKDKKDLENRQTLLRQRGLNIDHPPALLDLVLQQCAVTSKQ